MHWEERMQLNRTRCNLRGGMFPLSTLNVRLLAALLNDGLTAYYQRVPACHEKFKTFQNGVPLYVFLEIIVVIHVRQRAIV